MQRPSETVYEVDLVVKNLKNQKILPYSSQKQIERLCSAVRPRWTAIMKARRASIVAVQRTTDFENHDSEKR